MEKVKSDSKNIHSKRSLFLNVGLIMALTFCFIAFEFKVYIPEEERVDIPVIVDPIIFSDKVVPTVQKPKPKPVIPNKKDKVFKITETEVASVEQATDKPDIDTSDFEDLFNLGAPSNEKVADPTIYKVVESAPHFKGGLNAFYSYLADNLEYPRKEKMMGIDGTVYLRFVIEVDGSLSDISVLKGVSDGLDKEALRVLKATPKWEPGSNRGQPVRVLMTIPIKFQLN